MEREAVAAGPAKVGAKVRLILHAPPLAATGVPTLQVVPAVAMAYGAAIPNDVKLRALD
jgi:hypothetical protein